MKDTPGVCSCLMRWKAGIVIIFMLSCSQSFATERPYKDVEVDRAKSTVVKEFDRFDFLESIVSGVDGTIYTTNLFQGKIHQIKNGELSILTDLDDKLVGLELLDNENLIVTGSNSKNEGVIFQVDINTGKTSIISTVPDALLLNGITKLNDHIFLIADSFRGVIWKLDRRDNSVSIWLDHEMLASPSIKTQTPGVNGIKVYNNGVYISNTGKMTLVRIPVSEDGSAGKAKVIRGNVFIDDFVIDETGNVYGATHIHDSVIKITPEGKITIIAQSDQGVLGSTCVTMGYGSTNTLLISTNGGFAKQDKSLVVPAKIVALDLQ